MDWGWSSKFISGTIVLLALCGASTVSGFDDEPPRYNYDSLPKTSFSCRGRLTNRYYADAETNCQLFHICVNINSKEMQDFKFLCPNGTSFDQEHQVCMDYYQVVCHAEIGTNPLGQTYEIFKLSSSRKNSGLDSGKYSFVDPDIAERNTLGDDFQVDEYNNNKLAASQNSLNFQNSKHSQSQDIYNKNIASAAKQKSTTTPTPTTFSTTASSSTTENRLLFRRPIPTQDSDTSTTKRKPNLETYESYEIESLAGLTPQNSLGQLGLNEPLYKNYDYSYEDQEASPSTSTTTTTHKPQVFHNTFRSPLPFSSSTAVPPPQTFQQQASRFNDDFFRKIPSSTETSVSVSKAAQFYIHSSTKFGAPEVKQPVTNPFIRPTTELPNSAQKVRLQAARDTLYLEEEKQFGARYNLSEDLITDEKPNSFNQHIFGQSQPTEDVLTARSFRGRNNAQNQVNDRHRERFHQSTIIPPTTAEPPSKSTNNAVSYFQRVTPSESSRLFEKTTNQSHEPSSTSKYQSIDSFNADFGLKSNQSTTESPATTSTRRLGVRRRISRPRQQRPNHQFDPELKYSRRVEPTTTERNSQNDEIFDAEASVYSGPPLSNSFNSGHVDEIKSKSQSQIKSSTEFFSSKLGENFGKKSVSTRRQFSSAKPLVREATTQSIFSSTQSPRKIIKRIKNKITTTTGPPPTTTTQQVTTEEIITTMTNESTTTEVPTTPTVSYLSTLRPVIRINVKTKIGTRKFEKDSEFKVPPGTIQSSNAFDKLKKLISTTTTAEPELVTASEDEILVLKDLRKFTTLGESVDEGFTKLPTSTHPQFNFNTSNSTSVVKVTQKSQKSAIPTPISFSEPILPKLGNGERRVDVEQSNSVRESTKSPDYDYAYYDSDSEYADISSTIENKSYGKKPV